MMQKIEYFILKRQCASPSPVATVRAVGQEQNNDNKASLFGDFSQAFFDHLKMFDTKKSIGTKEESKQLMNIYDANLFGA